ncbi:hypothetical protein FNF28_04349 [Cafeteria roenbergensis]|uniref:CSC1/OSCA1-like 7TM region domain-containing protein n=1 Tax=Cafeteria roenbergensis TaxID=33653 RepID=A0A5A8DHN5_CAFRO|nr:hypothetical protein FNF28_04349 [Cafeteria roenbergensis]
MAEDVRHSIAITAKSRLAKAQRSSKLEGSRSLLVSRTPTGRGRGLESGSPVVDQGIRVGPKLHADAKNRSRSVVQWTSERDSERDQGLGGDSEDLKAKPNIVAAIRHVSARMFKRGAVPLLAHWPESCEAGCAGFWSLGRRLCGEPPSAIPPSDAAASATRWLRFGVLAEAGSPVVLHFVLMSTLWAGFFFATLVSIPAIILIAAAKASSSDGGEGLGAAELLFQQSGALASFSLHSLVSSSTVATASANSTGASVLQFADTKVVQDASLAAIGGPDTVDVRWVTLIVSFVDSLGALILMTCVSRFRTAVKVAMAVSAGRSIDLGAFSVVIRNLPPDATEDGLVEHLASLFRLDGDGDWVDPFCLKFQRRKGEKQAAFGEAPDPPDDEDEDEDESHGDDEGIQRKSTSGRAGAQGRAARHDVVYKVQGDTVEDDTDAARVANAPIANATVALPGGRKSGWIADAMAVPPVAEAWDIQARAEAVEGQLSRAKENVEFLEARTASLGKSCIDKLKLWYWERQASKLLEESQQLQSEHVAAELDPSERPAAFVVTLVASDASPAAPSDGQLPVAITAGASAGLSTFSAQRTGGGSSLAIVRPGAGADWGGVANCLKGAGLPDSLAGGEVLVSADGSAVLLADPCAGLCGSGIADGDDDQICVLWADEAKTVSSVVAEIDAGDGTLPGDPLGTYGADLLVMCVCASRLLKGGVQGLEAASELQTAAACDAVTSASAASQIEVLGLAVVLGIVGMATESSMLRLGEEEGFFASDQREAMIAQRLALVQVGNFLIPLLLGMNVPVMSTMLPDWNPVGNGDYRIASPPWFGDVASPIAIAVVLELFMEGATAAANAMCCRRLWAMQAAWRSRTQGELLEKLEPEDFLASALTSRAVFLAISAELMRPAYPSLGFVGGMGFCALYWADLYRALRVDSAPDTVASAATALFAARILLALGVARSVLAIFIYSDDAVMPSWRYSDFLTAASSAVGVDAQEAVSMPLILDRVVNTPPLAVAAFVILKFVVLPPLWAVAKPIISSTICAPCIALLARAKARTAKVTISSAKPFVPPLCGEMWVQLGAPATRMHPAVLNAADIQDGWRYASDTTRGMGGEWALVKIITGIDVAAKRQALLSLEQGRAIRGTDATTSMSPAESRQLSRVGSMVNNWTKEGAAHAASPSMMLRSKHKKRHKALAVDIPEPPKLPRTIPCKDGAGPNGTGEFRTAVPSGARKLTWEVIASRGPTSYRASMRGESTLAQAVRLWSKACEVAKDKRAAAERAAAGASQASSARRLGPGGAAAGASPKASPGSAEGATPKGRSKRRGIKSPLAKSALGIDTKVAPADLAILDF